MNNNLNHENFLLAIQQKSIVIIRFNSKSKGILVRKCIPFDYASSNTSKDKSMRYHFRDLNSPEGSHPLMVLPNDIISIEVTDEKFDPKFYVKWVPRWNVKRDW